MSIRMYGITQCDTIKRARTWLETHGIDYVFHDYKKAGIDRATLEDWVASEGWEQVLNRAGTTFRKLPEAARIDLDAGRAIDLMLAQPSMIRRPVLQAGSTRLIGFRPDAYASALGTR